MRVLFTLQHRTPGLLEMILAGLRDEPINLVVGVGRDRDPADFGPQPINVRLEHYLPQTLLLPHCAMFVTHGGFNSVKEAFSFGVPLLVVPIGGDQIYNAERTVALGLGQAVGPEDRTMERIRAAARLVLADPSYRERAEAMRRDIQALPDTEHAVQLLETLADQRRPLQAR